MLDGRLPVAVLDTARAGLKLLRFRERDVRAACPGREGADAPLSVQEVARRLGLKWQVVAHLAGAGLPEGGTEGIPAASVASFGARFVSGAALARKRRMSPGHLARMPTLRGVRPVDGPDVDGSRQKRRPGLACAAGVACAVRRDAGQPSSGVALWRAQEIRMKPSGLTSTH